MTHRDKFEAAHYEGRMKRMKHHQDDLFRKVWADEFARIAIYLDMILGQTNPICPCVDSLYYSAPISPLWKYA